MLVWCCNSSQQCVRISIIIVILTVTDYCGVFWYITYMCLQVVKNILWSICKEAAVLCCIHNRHIANLHVVRCTLSKEENKYDWKTLDTSTFLYSVFHQFRFFCCYQYLQLTNEMTRIQYCGRWNESSFFYATIWFHTI